MPRNLTLMRRVMVLVGIRMVFGTARFNAEKVTADLSAPQVNAEKVVAITPQVNAEKVARVTPEAPTTAAEELPAPGATSDATAKTDSSPSSDSSRAPPQHPISKSHQSKKERHQDHTTTPSPLQSAPNSEDFKVMAAALRKGDLRELRGSLEKHWRDEYNVPIICLFLFLIAYYWSTSTVRSTERLCQGMIAKTRGDVDSLHKMVKESNARWIKDVQTRETAVKVIQKQNMELTKTIDQMTTALKQCAPRNFSNVS